MSDAPKGNPNARETHSVNNRQPVKRRPATQFDDRARREDLSEEDEERYIRLVELSKMRCQYAESSLEGIDGSGSEDDLYETERVEKTVGAALEHASEIDDEFYRSAALHPVADLLTKAGQFDRAAEIIDQITVESINAKASEFLGQQKNKNV